MAQTPSSPQSQKVRVLTYTLPGGWQVLVGRTDADNDHLSFRVAKPDDWWFGSVSKVEMTIFTLPVQRHIG